MPEDKQFVTESLLSRLQDDDPAVVTCVLKLGKVGFWTLPDISITVHLRLFSGI